MNDPFAYADGSLVTNSSFVWNTHSGTTGQTQVASGKVQLSPQSEDVNALLAGQPYLPGGTTNVFYAGFTVRFTSLPSAGGGYFAHFKDATASGDFRARIWALTSGAGSNKFRLGISSTSGSTISATNPTDLSLNTDYRIVTRLANTNSAATLWIDPVTEGDASVSTTEAAQTATVATYAFRQTSGIGVLTIDDLLVGTTFADVFSGAPQPPSITTHPQNQTVTEGTNVTFSVVASGTPPLSYQWQWNGTNVAAATASTLTLTNVTLAQAGTYLVVVTNATGSTNSQPANLTVNPRVSPSITTQPESQTVDAGTNATFTVTATGTQPLSYQWQLNGTNLAGATSTMLVLTNVTTSQAGSYVAFVSNAVGSTNSQPATLIVISLPPPAFSVLTYNTSGNGETNWSTNSLQVQAIGRQIQHLQPDIITFQEIPRAYTYEMTNWVTAFFPGYYLATNSGTDNHIRSVIASRYPITRSSKWLDGAQLEPWGYTNANFTRDLFEAEISVPGLAQPLHVFTAHLKSTAGTTYADASAKRAAEAAAITNFFATNFFVLYPTHPYLLTGDLNDSDTDALAIQRLLSPQVGLHLTNPTNTSTGSSNTWSIRASSVSDRLDYVMPCSLLASNITGSLVFRTDKLNPPPPNLFSNDSRTASDHLPVLMAFGNPYDGKPYRITSITTSNQTVALRWESVLGQPYRLEASSNLTAWAVLASNLTATGTNCTFTTNKSGSRRFFRVYRAP